MCISQQIDRITFVLVSRVGQLFKPVSWRQNTSHPRLSTTTHPSPNSLDLIIKMAYRPRAPAPFSSPPPARSVVPFAQDESRVAAPISSGASSYAFLQSATAVATGRPGGNAAALASPPTASAFREAFCAFENGAVAVDGFRARLNALGITETPEATRLLGQPTRIGFAALSVALRRGGAEDGLVIPVNGFGPGGGPSGARARSTVNESDIESSYRATSKAREDRSTAQIESGAGLLLRGLGDALPQSATSDPQPHAHLSLKTATATEYDRQGDQGGGATEAAGVRGRARALLAAVDGGRMREAEATARFVDAGLFPAAIPGLASALQGYFGCGRLDTVGALRAIDVWITERLPPAVDARLSNMTAGMNVFRSPGHHSEKWMGTAANGCLPDVSRDVEPTAGVDRYAAQRAKALGTTVGTSWGGNAVPYKQHNQSSVVGGGGHPSIRTPMPRPQQSSGEGLWAALSL